MPVTVRYGITVAVSSTSAEEKDLANGAYQVVTNNLIDGGSWKETIPAGTIDQPLTLVNVNDVNLIVIRTNSKDPTQTPGEIRIRRNLITAEQISIIPLSGTPEGHMLLSTDGLTSLYVTNLAGVDMEMTITISASA